MVETFSSLYRRIVQVLSLPLLTFVIAAPAWAAGERNQTARYTHLDQFARQLPEQQARTIAQLARSLATAAQSDQDKARLIFAWLAYHIVYDKDYLQGQRTSAYTPAEVLQQRRAVCQEYADTFTELARVLQLPAFTVVGYSRTRREKNLPITPNHAWNVYQADGAWHLVDATWAAGGMTPAQVFVRSFDPFWFDTPPAAFVFSHLPVDTTRQLLPNPVRHEQAARWPYVEVGLLRWGVSGAAILKSFAHNSRPEPLPQVSVAPFEVQIDRVPRMANLAPHQAVSFCFSVSEETEVAVKNGSRTWVLLHRGTVREALVQPDPGPLSIVLWSRKNPEMRYEFLHYQVGPVLPLRERRHFPDSNHVAYLSHDEAQPADLLSAQANF